MQPNDIIGPYTLIRKLGRGSFGVVWLAEKRGQILTTQVAVKIPFDEELNLDPIKQEASLWLALDGHPNILRFIDADVYDNHPVIVSEYAPDGTLNEWLTRHGGKAPSIELAVQILDGLLAGLEHLHKKGIIHRDLKPENILLQGQTPRLADFGIARVLENTGAYSTRSFGTPKYMAPEAFRGKRSEQTDVWSTGVIFYQMLAGSWPFDGNDPVALMHAVIADPVRPLPETVSSDLRAVVAQALEKDSAARFRSATDMRKAIQRCRHFASSATSSMSQVLQEPTLLNETLKYVEEETLIKPDVVPVPQLKLEYWRKLESLLGQANSVVRLDPPKANHTIAGSLSHPRIKLFARATTQSNRLMVGVQLVNVKEIYDHLLSARPLIEKELRDYQVLEELQWKESKEVQPISEITVSNYQANVLWRDRWDEYVQWNIKTLEAFYRAFEPRIRAATKFEFNSVDVASSKHELVRRFWEDFESRRIQTASTLQLGKPIISSTGAGKSYRMKTLKGGFRLAGQINPDKNLADVNITVGPANYKSFVALHSAQNEIGREIGGIKWKLNAAGESWVILQREFDLFKEARWYLTHDWLLENIARFEKTFSPRLSSITNKETSSSPGLNDSSTEPTNIIRLLEQIGKAVFIRYFDQFGDTSLTTREVVEMLPHAYTLKSRRSRTGHARRIFREGFAKEALNLITKADGIDAATRKQAVKLLMRYSRNESATLSEREVLERIMADATRRKFWIVLWGDPTHSADEDEQIFNESKYDQGFPVKPTGLRVGDICFVHRIHISKIIYIAEVVGEPRESTLLEMEKEPWRKKWKWSVTTKNLTPDYGSEWRTRGRKTFDLLNQYNELHPATPAKISAIKFGRHVRIPVQFAEYLIGEIL